MRTREEVEALKANWLKDPCWDIEDTDGFKEYAVELAGFRVKHDALQRAVREKADAESYRNTPASEATLRDVFAWTALGGFIASVSIPSGVGPEQIVAERCYTFADAMMAARKK